MRANNARKLAGFLVKAFILVAVLVLGFLTLKTPEPAAKQLPDPSKSEIRPMEQGSQATEPAPLKKKVSSSPAWSDSIEAKAELAHVVAEAGGTERDTTILTAIIQCESEWAHYWEPWRLSLPAGAREGDVKISKGNVGFAQINRGVWEEPMRDNFGLDIYEPADNLRAAVVLYQWQGVAPWRQWSGHCFVPKLAAKGINV